MRSNKHLVSIDAKTLDKVSKSLDELQEAISSYVIALNSTERKKMPRMGEKTQTFVKKCYEFIQSNPSFRPGLLKMDAYEADCKDALGLYTIVNKAAQLHANLADTQLCAGSEAFQASLIFYNYVKVLAENNVPGARTVYEELRKRFPGGRRRKLSVEDTAIETDEAVV
jgi:hypothetical protein